MQTETKREEQSFEMAETSDPDAIELRDLFFRLAKRWKFLLCVTTGGTMCAGLSAFMLPNMYTATALILSPARQQSLSAVLMGQLNGLAGAVAPSLGLKDPAEQYIGILGSRTISDELVGKFRLQAVYSSQTREDARRKLLRRSTFVLGKDSMIRLSVEDRNPQRACDLVNAFITDLNEQDNRLATTESSQRRIFFEREVQREKDTLAAAELSLKETQRKTGVLDVSNQAQVVIGSIARLRAEITMREVSVQRLEMGATASNSDLAGQQKELSVLRSELAKLESGRSDQPSGDPIVPMANVPQAGLEYLRALREVKYHDSLFEVLAKQYEAAKIDEAREAPIIQVVDTAVPPEKKSGPPRTAITAFGAALSAALGAVMVYFQKRQV